MKRLLTPEEIEDVCACIQHPSLIESVQSLTLAPDPNGLSEYQYVLNAKEQLRKQLQTIEIYPDLLPKMKQEIRKQYYKSILQPGEMVGVIAASSIGEQNTQASLNSFHQSGSFKANLTGGLARLTELMNASENIKTPSLTIYLDKSIEQTLENVRQICFSKLIWVEIDDLVQKVDIMDKNSLDMNASINSWYTLFSILNDSSFEQGHYVARIQLDPYKLWRHQISMKHICEKIKQHIETENKLFFAYSHESLGIFDIWVKDDIASFASIMNLQENSKLSVLVTEQNKMINYIKKVILPNILNTHLSGVEGIQDCYYTQVKGKEWRIDTKGGKLKPLLSESCVDGLRCRSNNLHEILQLFGIEATKQFLRDEFGSLIKVNPRDVELLIDAMTVSGSIQRVSRNGIDRKQVGTIAKASFEQPVDNFLISASAGEIDPLRGVSSAITVGKLAEIGTGFMDLYVNKEMLESMEIMNTQDPMLQAYKINYDDVEVEHISEEESSEGSEMDEDD